MPLRLSFDLGDSDLAHFEQVAQQTQALARAQSEDAIVAAARKVLDVGTQAQAAEFVKERYSRLQCMIEMVSDPEWRVEGDDRQRVLNALACFSVSATESPAVSVLDQAILIELVSRDLQHDLAAYRDFGRFRESYARRHRKADEAAKDAALQQRRALLQARMRERRKRDLEKAGGSVRKLFSLFGL
jgi:hypothetical protein